MRYIWQLILYVKNFQEVKIPCWVKVYNNSNRTTSVARYSYSLCVCQQVQVNTPQDVSLATQHCFCTTDTFITTLGCFQKVWNYPFPWVRVEKQLKFWCFFFLKWEHYHNHVKCWITQRVFDFWLLLDNKYEGGHWRWLCNSLNIDHLAVWKGWAELNEK